MTGPFFLIVLWVPVCIALAIWVGRKFIKNTLPLKIAGGGVVFLIALLLPIADEIAGRIYFNHLCETEAGVKVYQTIELPAEYWDKDGKPNFYDARNGNLKLPLEQYATGKSKTMERSLNIEDRLSILHGKQTGELLSEMRWFLFWHGWVFKNFSPHNSAIICDGGIERSVDFYSKLFEPTKMKDEGESIGSD